MGGTYFHEIKVKPILENGYLILKACDCETICNNDFVNLIICDCMPCDADHNTPVIWRDGQVDFTLCDEGGHNIYADQIYPRMVLRCTAAVDTMRLAVHNKYFNGYNATERYPLRCSCHAFEPVKCECPSPPTI